MHLGTDFAAPTEPVMASGDGVVTRAQWCGGGGNCVKIKHNSVYQTVYAHMSKFGRGIKKGPCKARSNHWLCRLYRFINRSTFTL